MRFLKFKTTVSKKGEMMSVGNFIKFFLIVFICSVANVFGDHDTEITEEDCVGLVRHVELCGNDPAEYYLACVYCDEEQSELECDETEYETFTEAESAVRLWLHEMHSDGGSLIENYSMNHFHFAYDYYYTYGGSPCSSCTVKSEVNVNKLSMLTLKRIHRYRNMTEEFSSFGPGIYTNYDISVNITTNGGGYQMRVFAPSYLMEITAIDGLTGDPDLDGIYKDVNTNAFDNVILYTSEMGLGDITSDPGLAMSAVLTRHNGYKMYFELINGEASLADAGWSRGDVGLIDVPGESSVYNDSYLVRASGTRIGNQRDEFHYVYDSVDGDCTLVAQVTDLYTDKGLYTTEPGTYSKAGVMIRETMDDNSTFAYMCLTPKNGAIFQRRTTTNANASGTTESGIEAPYYVKVDRSGDTFTGYISTDGGTWTEVNSATISMTTEVFVGLAVTSYEDDVLASAIFDNVTLTGTAGSKVPESEDFSETEADIPGKIVKLEDRNGYGIEMTYKSFTAQEVLDSYSRQYQFDTITDPNGRELGFVYRSTPVSGSWVIESTTMPNGEIITYDYDEDDEYLSEITYPHGNKSTFVISYSTETSLTSIVYDDAAAFKEHRKKTAFYSAPYTSDNPSNLYNQASNIIRWIKNADNEVTFLNVFNATTRWIYSGAGSFKEVQDDHVKHAISFSTNYGVSGNFNMNAFDIEEWESDYYTQNRTGSIAAKAQKLAQQTPDSTNDATGVSITYTYGDNMNISEMEYSDTTTEKKSFNLFNQVTRYEDRLERVIKTTYDGNGNMTEKEVGLTGSSDTQTSEYAVYRYRYYPNTDDVDGSELAASVTALDEWDGLLRFEFDANKNRLEYIYYTSEVSDGNPGGLLRLLKEIKEPDDADNDSFHTKVEYAYDEFGRIVTSTDAVGRGTDFLYDKRNRLVQTTFHDGSTEFIEYPDGDVDDANLVIRKKDRNGNITKFDYDDSGRVSKETIAYSTSSGTYDSDFQLTNENTISDVNVKLEIDFEYVSGTTLVDKITRDGDVTERDYDHRHRLIEEKKYTIVSESLTTQYEFLENKLFKKTDPYSRETYYNYRDSDSRLERVIQETTPSGLTLTTYAAVDSTSRDTSENADYLITDYTLDAEGQRTSIIDPRNITLKQTFDSRGRLTTREEAYGTAISAKTETIYDDNSNVTEIRTPRYFVSTDPGYLDANIVFAYTRRNLKASRTVPKSTSETSDPVESFSYYPDGKPHEHTDFRGNRTISMWHECCGRFAGQIDQEDHGTISNTDFYGNVTHTAAVDDLYIISSTSGSLFLPNNSHNVDDNSTVNETTYQYDARHRKIAETRWLTKRGTVDANDPPIASQSGTDGLTTLYAYDDHIGDSLGLDSQLSDLLSKFTSDPFSTTTNHDGSAVVITKPSGEIHARVFDGIGRELIRGILDPDDDSAITWVITNYDNTEDNLLRTDTEDATGDISHKFTDGAGRLLKAKDELDKITTYSYDNNSNLVSFRDPNSIGEDCTYDERNRKIACQDTQEATDSVDREFVYDSNNNLVKTIDTFDKEVEMTYDSRDRLSTKSNRIGSVVEYLYDKNSNLTSLTDGEDRETTYEYNERNLKDKTTYPDSGEITFTYDAAKRLSVTTDQMSDTITRNYDLANRMTTRVYNDGEADEDTDTFTYDKDSRVLTAEKERYDNKVTYTYDDAGRKFEEKLTVRVSGTPATFTVSHAYTDDNLLKTITYPDSSTVDRTFTARDQLNDINTNVTTNIANYDYDDGKRKEKITFGNNSKSFFYYDRNDNFLTEIETKKSGGTKLKELSFRYIYDTNKNIKHSTTLGNLIGESWDADFDDEDRLESWSRQSSSTNTQWGLSLEGDFDSVYMPNASGNITRGHSVIHETTDVGGTTLYYDAKGNLTQDNNSQNYTWDFDNLLRYSTPSGGSVTEYSYDALGRRVSKKTGSAETVFVCSGQQVVAEYDENDALLRKYVYGNYVDEPLAMIEGATTIYYHQNYQYSVVGFTNSSQNIVELVNYTPHGQRQFFDSSGSQTTSSSTNNPYWYTGRYRDEESGLDYFRARYYSPELGRFVSRDPIGYADGLNLYRGYFVPNGTDPSGLICDHECSDIGATRKREVQVAVSSCLYSPRASELGEAGDNALTVTDVVDIASGGPASRGAAMGSQAATHATGHGTGDTLETTGETAQSVGGQFHGYCRWYRFRSEKCDQNRCCLFWLEEQIEDLGWGQWKTDDSITEYGNNRSAAELDLLDLELDLNGQIDPEW